eukprot:TRINITY_DN10952_c0_g1_i1.p2 TRINITY_DN10952_c0_g1~~TRINITY_DN10952_c0_g1_i1.p2  ORF type:complete len:152 (-),score=53.14 TRINITY_DN10952_c0_g1_i1:160-615(-)
MEAVDVGMKATPRKMVKLLQTPEEENNATLKLPPSPLSSSSSLSAAQPSGGQPHDEVSPDGDVPLQFFLRNDRLLREKREQLRVLTESLLELERVREWQKEELASLQEECERLERETSAASSHSCALISGLLLLVALALAFFASTTQDISY